MKNFSYLFIQLYVKIVKLIKKQSALIDKTVQSIVNKNQTDLKLSEAQKEDIYKALEDLK